MLRDWVNKGLGMHSRVYATGHIKDPVPLIEKRRGLSPGLIHQVIIITGLNTSTLLDRVTWTPWWPTVPKGFTSYSIPRIQILLFDRRGSLTTVPSPGLVPKWSLRQGLLLKHRHREIESVTYYTLTGSEASV